MDEITITGIGDSICTATASIPQLLKIIKCRKANDISVNMLLILIAGLGLWVLYGFLKHDFILVVANSMPFLVNILILIFYKKYKK